MISMDIEEKLRLIERNTVEIVTREELKALLETNPSPKGYLGYEPSGLFHIGWMIWARKVKDLIDAGVKFTLLEATWHAYINDKFGGNMEAIKTTAKYIKHSLYALGIPVEKIEFIDAEKLVSDPEYWGLVIKSAKNTTLQRLKRALTIMGRKTDEAESDSSKLIYPLMQVSDIFYLDLDIALGGLDQRRAHMLQREIAEKLNKKKVIAVHTPLLTSLKGVGRAGGGGIRKDDIDQIAELKMSKSKPESTILIHDDEGTIKEKIKKAYCPPREVDFNPIIEINRYIFFAIEGFELRVKEKGSNEYLTINSYYELEKLYIEDMIHPADLKESTAEALIKILEPVRKYFSQNKEARELALRVAEYQGLKINLE